MNEQVVKATYDHILMLAHNGKQTTQNAVLVRMRVTFPSIAFEDFCESVAEGSKRAAIKLKAEADEIRHTG